MGIKTDGKTGCVCSSCELENHYCTIWDGCGNAQIPKDDKHCPSNPKDCPYKYEATKSAPF